MNSLQVFSQIHPPGIKWYNGYFPDEDLCDDESTAKQSGEDWFFDVIVSYESSIAKGLVATGYQVKQTNINSPLWCQTVSNFNTEHYCELRDYEQNADYGHYRKGTVWFFDLEGHEKWYIDIGETFEIFEGRKIIQTNDGNYVVVGDCAANYLGTGSTYTPHILYNPGVSTIPSYLDEDTEQKGFVAKIDSSTHTILWIYVYGLQDETDPLMECAFFDVVEGPSPDYNLIVAGRADNDASGVTNAVIFNLEEDGTIIWKAPITSDDKTFSEFNCLKLAPSGTEITACGAEAPSGKTFRFDGPYSYLANFPYSSTAPTAISTTFKQYGDPNNPGVGGAFVNFIYDFEYLSNGSLIIPSVEECAGCFYYAGEPQHARIYKVSTSTFSVISTTDLGELTAYDMQSGIDKTADGGFVFISTKPSTTPVSTTTPILMDDGANVSFEPYPTVAPVGTGSPATITHCPNWSWYTDAYIAKFDASASLEWEKTYPYSKYDPTVTNRGDIKREECLYDIVQLPDESYVACGNNSANLDDHILLKLHSDCQNRLGDNAGYDIGNGATPSSYTTTITFNTTWNSNKKIRGTVFVTNGATLNITNGAVIEFADTRQTDIPTTLIIDAGAKLIITDATLTALSDCPNSVWDGVQIYGDITKDQSPTSGTPTYDQGYCNINNGTIEHARIGVRLSESYYEPGGYWYTPMYSKTGGIVETYNAHFIDNWKDVEFMKYNSLTGAGNVSHFDKTEFKYTGAFPEPWFFMDQEHGDYTGYKDFVTLWDVQGVSFLGCSFENTTADYMKHKGTGIYSINATYNVSDYMQYILGIQTYTHTSFTNIFRGVQAFMYSAVNGPTLNISNAVFNHVRQGIGICGFTMPYPIISNNTINLETDGSILHDQGDAWGIHATGCEYYYIQENKITSDFIQDPDFVQRAVVGIAINNRHPGNTMVYKNSIEKTRTAILPFGMNGYGGIDAGLLLKCNLQSDNAENDIKVVNDGGTSGAIKDNQGGCVNLATNEYKTPAANTFTDLTNGASTINLNTSISVSPYFYHYNVANIPETPYSFSIDVTPTPCSYTYVTDIICPTRLVINDGTWDDGWDWSEKINEAAESSDIEKEIMERLYFNHLMNTNHTTDIITYLKSKSPKNNQDSLNLYYCFTALRQYDSSLAVLNSLTISNDQISFLKKLTQALKGDSISYQLRTPFTDSLQYWILDSTNIQSIYAENILRLTGEKYYPFRIPQNDSGSNKSQVVIQNPTVIVSQNYVSLYPNPNQGDFVVSFDRPNMDNILSMSVFDAMGNRVLIQDKISFQSKYNIHINPIPGVYILRIYSVDGKDDYSRTFSIK